jgi:hypothetical protein
MGKEIFFAPMTCGQEIIQVVGVIVPTLGFIHPIYFE